MAHSYVDHGLARLRLPLIVLAQTSTPTQPGERPLYDPTPFHHLEWLALLPLRLRDGLQHPTAELQGPLSDTAVVDRVGEDLRQPREVALDLCQDQPGPVPVLDVGGMDHHRQDQPEGVDQQVPLAAVDHLVGVLAPRPALLGRLDALAVDDRHAGAGLPPGLAADLIPQGVVEPLPGAVVAPLAEVIVAGAPGG